MRALTVVVTFVSCAALGAGLFAAAGTADWPGAWVWLALLFAAGAATAVVADERVLRERMRGPVRDRQERWDRFWQGAFGLLFAAWLVLLGLDAVRYRWTSLPGWVAAAGGVAVVAGNVVIVLALRLNPDASGAVRIHEGQHVATTGPYALVRHPMYSGTLLYFPGTAALLGSGVGLVLTPALVAMIAVRTAAEDKVLQRELPGYKEYAARVRYRLVPRVW